MAETKILVVDDDPKILERFEEFLSKEGYAVETAKNGEIALEMLDRDYFDVALIDLNMPKMDGMTPSSTWSTTTPTPWASSSPDMPPFGMPWMR